VTLEYMLMQAYGIEFGNVSGPAWVSDNSDDRALYTVTGLIPPDTSAEQFKLMLQNLLAERFHLTLHHGTKEYAGYDLVVSEAGAKIRKYVPQPDAGNADGGGQGPDADGFPRLKPNASVATLGPRVNAGWGMFRSRYRMSMTDFASALVAPIKESSGIEMGATNARVADKTGLTGVYEFTLGFAGTIILSKATPPSSGGGDTPVPAVSDPGEVGPTLFNALEKQLGLKLVKAKNVPVDILVIDHADKVPTEN
jgi:uncharacterized protein (TIGR03435 family)